MAAPAELRTPNMHRAKRFAPRECGWKQGDSGYSAEETFSLPQRTKTHYEPRITLTPTGLLMEGHFTQIYGPPPNRKRFEVGRKNSPRKCIRPLSGELLSGHLMMIRTCRSF